MLEEVVVISHNDASTSICQWQLKVTEKIEKETELTGNYYQKRHLLTRFAASYPVKMKFTQLPHQIIAKNES